MLSLPYIDPRHTDPLLREILASTRDAVVAETADGQLLAVNPRFLELIGWTDTYAGESLDTLIAHWTARANHPEHIEDYFQTARANLGHPPMELHPSQGQVVEARCLVSHGSGQSALRIWFFQEWRTSALAWVSHEIKNPLNAVLGFSELLDEAVSAQDASEAVKSSLRGLRIGARHLQSVLGDLLDLSRLESGVVETRPEWVDVAQFLGDLDVLFRTSHKRRGLELVIEAPPVSGLQLWTDPGRLAQILGNLLSNSLRFTKRGWVALRVLQSGEGWDFVVEDSGVGIPLDQQKTIFEPFVQRQGQDTHQFGGSGLGLAISRSLARGLGGELTLKSEPEHGSRFTVSFARLAMRSQAEENHPQSTEPAGTTILIADDERTNHLILRGFLRSLPATLLEATDGLQAVELWKAKRPQVLLMDLRMPGLSGLEAAKRIRALDPRGSTRLLAMSATKPSSIELAEGRPLWSGFIEKPFSKQEILNFLSKHLTIVDDSFKSS